MRKTRKTLAAILSIVCAGVVGAGVANWNVVSAENELPKNGDFFTVSNGTLVTSEAYESNLGKGLKLSITEETKGTSVISYEDYIPVANMDEAISFQILPTVSGEPDFMSMLMTFTDSVDETQTFTLTFISGEDTWWGNKGLASHVALVSHGDLDTFSGNGAVKIAGTEQYIRGKDHLVGGQDYITTGGTLRYPGTTDHTPYFAAENNETSMLSVSYSGGVVYLNGKVMADLKNDTYQSESVEDLDATANADLIARYTDSYVDGLFSSGKVKLEMKLIEARANPAIALGTVNLSVFAVGGTSLYGNYENNFASTDSEGKSNVGTKIALSGNDTIKVGTMDKAQLAQGVAFQLIPTEYGKTITKYVQVIFRDSVDSTNLISMMMISGKSWWDAISAQGFASMEEGFTTDMYAFSKLTSNPSQQIVAKDNIAVAGESTGGYSNHGTLFLADGATGAGWDKSTFPILGAADGQNAATIKVYYSGTSIYFNNGVKDILIADIADDNFQTLSTNDANTTETTKAKYTDEYVANLFSSGKVSVEIKTGVLEGSGSISLVSLGGASLASWQQEGVGLKDTVAPVVSVKESELYNKSTNTYFVEEGKAYTATELAALVEAKDSVGNATLTGFEVYNVSDEKYPASETVTFAAGDYVKVYAQDNSGNQGETTIEIAFAKKVTVNGKVSIVADGAKFVFEAVEEEGKIFIGYAIGGGFYPAGYEMTIAEDVTATPVFVSAFEMVQGASIRIPETGIRFTTTISDEDYATITEYAKSVVWGTRITSDELAGYLDIETTVWATGSTKEYKAVMTDIPEANYTTVFKAAGYVDITYSNDETVRIYAESGDTARSIAQVAYMVQTNANGGEDEYADLNTAEKAVIDEYAAAYDAE